MNEIREKLISIIGKVIGEDVSFLNENDDFSELEIDSLKYIKILVEIESEYDCEFADDYLNHDSVNTITQLESIVLSMISKWRGFDDFG